MQLAAFIVASLVAAAGAGDVPGPRLRAARVTPHTSLALFQEGDDPATSATVKAPVSAVAVNDADVDATLGGDVVKAIDALKAHAQQADLDDDNDGDAEDMTSVTAAPQNATQPLQAADLVHEDEPAAEAHEDHASNPAFNLESIEQSLAKLGGTKAKATPGMVKFVTLTKGMIKNDMKPKVLDAHKKDQGLLNSYKNGFGRCLKGRTTSVAATLSLGKTRRSGSSAHKSCRKSEADLHKVKEQCDNLLDAKEETKKAACQALKDLSRNPNTEADNCHAANKETFEDWLDRNEQWFITKNKEFKDNKAKCKAATEEVDKLEPQCVQKTKAYLAAKAQCDVKQDQLEEATCNLGKKMSQNCNTYLNCYDNNRATYLKTKPGIKKQEQDRKGEWRVLMRVECLLDTFAKEDGEVDQEVIGKCKNTTHDTTHLDLAYPAIPVKQACKPLPAVPGSNAFKQAEYSSLPQEADAKPMSLCVVEAGAGLQLGAPPKVPSAQCSMAGEYLKASARGSCMLSNTEGKPIKVDYTKNEYTTYSFTMKFEGNADNFNRMPVGGFKVCNTDRNSYRRGRSPEFNFYDIKGQWGYSFVRHPHTYSRYQNRKADANLKALPKDGKDVHWEITMQYRGNRRLYVYSWKVNGVQLRAYNNYITNCWSNGRHNAFVPRIWAWGATKGVYIKDFKVYQGLVPVDMVQIIGTGIPRTPYTVACAERGKRYRGRGIPGYGRYRTKNVLNCQKRCSYLAGCVKFTYQPDGWCYYYSAVGLRKENAPRNFISGPPSCESPYQTGLKAEFFFYKSQLRRLPNLLHAKPDKTRTDLTVWYAQTSSPWPGLARSNANYYAARWTGSMLIKEGGKYRFDLTSDDGSFLWIDGQVVVSNPGLHGPRTVYRWVKLKAGYHDVMISAFENRGGANLYFRYLGPDTMFHHWVVPTEVLRPSDKDVDKKHEGPFGTPDNKKYYRFPDQTKLKKKGDITYLLATVRAKNDAHIGLFPEQVKDPVNQGGAFYEFVLGGWSDKRSAIRRSRSEHPRSFPYTLNIVSKYEYRNFWVAANKKTGVVSAGKGHMLGKYKFMEWKDSKPMDIKSFGVMTGWSGTGEWYFVDKPLANPNVKPAKWGKEGWFMGAQGEDCTKTCAEQGRTCDENIRAGFSYNKLRAYVKEEMGVTCQKDTRRWWAHDQPCYVSGGQDSNQNKCLAFSNIPTKVRCSGKHPKVMRWCKCTATNMVPHMEKQSQLMTWDQMKKMAEKKGGRLMTLAEARLFLERKGGVIFRGRDVWAAVEEKGNEKDWVQLGSRHRPGTSHVEKYKYPSWGSNVNFMKRYRKTTFNYLLWVTERKR